MKKKKHFHGVKIAHSACNVPSLLSNLSCKFDNKKENSIIDSPKTKQCCKKLLQAAKDYPHLKAETQKANTKPINTIQFINFPNKMSLLIVLCFTFCFFFCVYPSTILCKFHVNSCLVFLQLKPFANFRQPIYLLKKPKNSWKAIHKIISSAFDMNRQMSVKRLLD